MPHNPTIRHSLFKAFAPSIIQLETNLFVASFPLMKLYPAYSCIIDAIGEGVIDRDTRIIETSSGTMALGLAIVCSWFGYSLTIVTDGACSTPLRSRLEDLGADVEVITQPTSDGGIQGARLARLAEIQASSPNTWWLNQYANPGNPDGYQVFAEQVLQMVGPIDYLVGAVGSGGSMCGSARFLRQRIPGMQAVAVDTFNSILFGQPDGPRILRGLGNSVMPKNLDHATFDQVHWVAAAEAYTATRILHRETGLFRGGTSGAAWMVARHLAAREPRRKVLCLFPDDGHRYQETIYSDQYMAHERLWIDHLPPAPRMISDPNEPGGSWSYMEWKRMSLAQTIGSAGRDEWRS